MNSLRQRAGITLMELVAVLAILSTIGAVVTIGLRREDPPAAVDEAARSIAAARRDALQRRRPVTAEIRGVQPFASHVTALPDGRIVADSTLGGSRMTVFSDAR